MSESTNYATRPHRPAANDPGFVQDDNDLLLTRDDCHLLIDALDELDRDDNPQRPFTPSFQAQIHRLREALTKAATDAVPAGVAEPYLSDEYNGDDLDVLANVRSQLITGCSDEL